MSAPVVRCPLAIEPGADAEHDGVGDVGEELRRRGSRSPTSRWAAHPRLEVLTARAGGTRSMRRLLVDEGLGLADPRQALLEVGVDDRDALPGEVVGPGRLAPEDDGRDGQRDDHAQGDERELGVQDEQGDTDADEGARC